MWDFLKRLFSDHEDGITVVVLDDNDPNLANTFKLRSMDAMTLFVIIFLLAVLTTTALFFLTPISSIYQQRVDDNFRDEVIAINERVIALQDSLTAREVQLDELKNFVRTVPDTTFELGEDFILGLQNADRNYYISPDNNYSYNMLTQHEVMNVLRKERKDDFPSFFPIAGPLSQGFSIDLGHYGIDIAATSDSEFKVIADGTVLSTTWTINFGFVISVQHADGLISVYKHAAGLYKEKGDYVLKGDFLGIVGDRGVSSTGSHLHLEMWKNGAPQDPLLYLN
ncbi:MAG: M23 family metallopeptidase [Balneolaceae bacterium]